MRLMKQNRGRYNNKNVNTFIKFIGDLEHNITFTNLSSDTHTNFMLSNFKY